MNADEARAWKAFTAAHKNEWIVDPVHNRAEDLLIHIGGESGKFAAVRGNLVEVGSFSDAIPNIGEASFKVEGKKEFNSNSEAIRFLINRGGVGRILERYSSPA